MNRRVGSRLLLAGALLGLACTDQNPLTPDLPDPSVVPAPYAPCTPAFAKLILSEIKQIYRARPLLEVDAGVRFALIVAQCTRNPAEARARAVRLSAFAAQKYQDHRLINSVTWSDVSRHIDHLYQYVGLTAPGIPATAVGAGAAVAVVEPADPPTLVTDADVQVGVSIPTGAISQTQTVLVTITPDPLNANPFPNPTGFEEVGTRYNFQTFPEVPLFNQPVLVGICVDTAGLPYEQVHRLQLAHRSHADTTRLEVLARVAAGFLDCDSYAHARRGPIDLAHAGRGRFLSRLAQRAFAALAPQRLHAATLTVKAGGLGGQTSSFSDFGAIDPGKLVFTVQPSSTPSGSSITPAPEVTVQRENGTTITGDTGNVTVAIDSNPGGGTLSGTTTVLQGSGVATFAGLSINSPGLGYTLTASATTYSGAVPQPATSAGFDITGTLSWAAQSSGTLQSLYGVWGASGSDVFAVGGGGGTILHYNGASWTSQTIGSDSLYGVWGAGGSDVFAVGYGGAILHYNGTSWSAQTSGTLNWLFGVWGTSGSDVFAVGSGGTILHYNGTSWAPQTSGTVQSLQGVWGTSGSDVFAVGEGGTILHYNGTTWSAQTSGTTDPFYGVWGAGGSDVFAAGTGFTIYHFNGTSWAAQSTGIPEPQRNIWGTSGSNVFAVGNGGTMLHYNGTSWAPETSGTFFALYGVWGAGATDVFVVGSNGTILHGTP